jgi:hypothetical protein
MILNFIIEGQGHSEMEDLMNRNVFVFLGIALVFHLGGCAAVGEADRNTENQSVIVRRTDNKGEEPVRIYMALGNS